jgi:hypothetical protein
VGRSHAFVHEPAVGWSCMSHLKLPSTYLHIYSTRVGDLLFRQIEGDKLYRDIKEELDE